MSEGNHITVCPHTSVILNCTATQVATLKWHDQNGQIAFFAPTDIDTEGLRVREVGPYTLTLVAVDNPVDFVADFTSTFEVMVDDIDSGTNITCQIFGNQKHMLIYKEGKHPFTIVHVCI